MSINEALCCRSSKNYVFNSQANELNPISSTSLIKQLNMYIIMNIGSSQTWFPKRSSLSEKFFGHFRWKCTKNAQKTSKPPKSFPKLFTGKIFLPKKLFLVHSKLFYPKVTFLQCSSNRRRQLYVFFDLFSKYFLDFAAFLVFSWIVEKIEKMTFVGI